MNAGRAAPDQNRLHSIVIRFPAIRFPIDAPPEARIQISKPKGAYHQLPECQGQPKIATLHSDGFAYEMTGAAPIRTAPRDATRPRVKRSIRAVRIGAT